MLMLTTASAAPTANAQGILRRASVTTIATTEATAAVM